LLLFCAQRFVPHAVCLTGSLGLLWGMVIADALIAAAYFSIPVTLLRYLRKRGPKPGTWVAGLFSAFIFACGLTHVLDIWTVWQPDYGALVLAKTGTAVLSIATAVTLWLLLPRALKTPAWASCRPPSRPWRPRWAGAAAPSNMWPRSRRTWP